ncbi:MAG: hypothetical protein HY699_05015 [Deltaproteobacteria bacterium]|nr:hypothetical protein [Deltaproteobacteria bacterium]
MWRQVQSVWQRTGVRLCVIAVGTLIGVDTHDPGADRARCSWPEVTQAAEYVAAAAQTSDGSADADLLRIVTKERYGAEAQATEISELKEYATRSAPSHARAVAELVVGHALSESRDEAVKRESKEWLRKVVDGFPKTREARLAEVDLSLLDLSAVVGAPLAAPPDALRKAWSAVRDAMNRALPDYRALDSAGDPVTLALRQRLGWSEREPLAATAKMRIAQLTVGVEGFKEAKGLFRELVSEYGGRPAGDWAETVLKAYGESGPGTSATPSGGGG